MAKRVIDQIDLFAPARQPVLVAYGGGVDSTAMIIELVERGERIDHVLFADTNSEKPETYAYITIFAQWLKKRNIPFSVVKYQVRNFKNYPRYQGLFENSVTNATLPGISFGFSSCSAKHKIAPQDEWAKSWPPAIEAWAANMKVTKLIGYDAGKADSRRYAERSGYTSDKYDYRYPLREWGWDREACIARIKRAGLPVPPKSACYFCLATKPAELREFAPALLRRIVLMEARAAPRLNKVEGLWRKRVLGRRGAEAKPGSMTEMIREERLLPPGEIDRIIAIAPASLVAFQKRSEGLDIEDRPELSEWLELFDMASDGFFDMEGIAPLYPEHADA